MTSILGILEVLPPACPSLSASCTTGGIPSEYSYRNLGTVKNKGFELGVDGAVNQALNIFANYSYQAEPVPDFALSEINLPPTNRFNAGFNFSQGHFLGNLSVSFVDEAFFQDVLDARYAGPTEAYTQVNGAFGVKFLKDKLTTTVKDDTGGETPPVEEGVEAKPPGYDTDAWFTAYAPVRRSTMPIP